MKKYDDMTLEEMIEQIYKSKSSTKIIRIIVSILLILIASSRLFFHFDAKFDSLFLLVLIACLMIKSDLNSQAITKIYEKMSKDK